MNKNEFHKLQRGDLVKVTVAPQHMHGRRVVFDMRVDYPPMHELTGKDLGFQGSCLGFTFDCPDIVSVERA